MTCKRAAVSLMVISAILIGWEFSRTGFEIYSLPAERKVVAPADEPPPKGSVDASGKFTKDADSTPPLTREAAEVEMKKSLNLQTLGPDTFALGLVKFDKRARTMRFPAKVNLRDEVIEYALVASTGKAHEALFVTDAKPEHLHLASLLLNVPTASLTGQLDEAATFPASNGVKITVTWKKNGPDAVHDLAELVLVNAADGQSSAPMTAGTWFYGGSRFNALGFLASQEGSFIGLISDSAALIENPRVDRARDDIHFPNKALLPAKGTQVEFVVHLP